MFDNLTHGLKLYAQDPSTEWDVRRVQGRHGTTPDAAWRVIQDGYLRGSEMLPQSYFKGYVDGGVGDVQTAVTMMPKVLNSSKNACGLIFELTCKHKLHNYSAYLRERTDDVGGTYWDQEVAMAGGIAHYRSGKENRYSVDGRNATLIQLWVEESALETWNRPF